MPHFEIQPFAAPAWYWEQERRAIDPLFGDLVAVQRPDVVLSGRPVETERFRPRPRSRELGRAPGLDGDISS